MRVHESADLEDALVVFVTVESAVAVGQEVLSAQDIIFDDDDSTMPIGEFGNPFDDGIPQP